MTLIADALYFDNLYQTTQANTAPPANLSAQMHVSASGFSGAFSDTQPVTEPGVSSSGYAGGGMNSMLYGRIYITPSNFSLGAISNSQVRTFRIWNARFDTVTLSSITEQDAEGLTLTPPFSIPASFAPLLEADFSLSVNVEGPPSIQATYTFQFGVEAPSVFVTGSRITMFGFEPNWKDSVDESFEWQTQIISSYNGSEQRIQMRTVPRRRLEYKVLLKNEKAQYFDSVMWGWQNRAFALPLWQYRQATTALVSVGATSISVPTTDTPFLAGELAVLYVDPGNYEVVDILSVGAGVLNLSRPTGAAWPIGTSVYPISISQIEGNVPVVRHTDRALEASLRFMSLPPASDPYIPTAVATSTYNGYEILLEQPDWSGGLSGDLEYLKDVIDFNSGAIELAATVDTPTIYRPYRWVFKTRTQVRQFREFLGRRRGQLKPLYIPSWNDDLRLTQTVSAGATSIVCADRMFYLMVGLDPARSHIMIRTRANGDFLRPITAISQAGGEITLGIGASPLGVSLSPADVKAIHLVSLYRLASDTVNVSWKTTKVATVDAVMKLVKA